MKTATCLKIANRCWASVKGGQTSLLDPIHVQYISTWHSSTADEVTAAFIQSKQMCAFNKAHRHYFHLLDYHKLRCSARHSFQTSPYTSQQSRCASQVNHSLAGFVLLKLFHWALHGADSLNLSRITEAGNTCILCIPAELWDFTLTQS